MKGERGAVQSVPPALVGQAPTSRPTSVGPAPHRTHHISSLFAFFHPESPPRSRASSPQDRLKPCQFNHLKSPAGAPESSEVQINSSLFITFLHSRYTPVGGPLPASRIRFVFALDTGCIFKQGQGLHEIGFVPHFLFCARRGRTFRAAHAQESPWPSGPPIEMKVAPALVGQTATSAPDRQVRLRGVTSERVAMGRRRLLGEPYGSLRPSRWRGWSLGVPQVMVSSSRSRIGLKLCHQPSGESVSGKS